MLQEGHYVGAVETVGGMLARQARQCPDKTALIHRATRLSFGELHGQSNRFANHLLAIGLQPGDRVGFLVEKTADALVAFLGVAGAGGVFFPIPNHETDAHIQAVLKLTRPFALVVSSKLAARLAGWTLPCAPANVVVLDGGSASGGTAWADVLRSSTPAPPPVELAADQTVYLNMTSGTTGQPKAAITTHANIFWNTVSSVERLRLTGADVHLCMFPVAGHPHELFARPLYLGGTMVLLDRIAPAGIFAAVREHGVTCLMATASIYQSMVQYHELHGGGLGRLTLAESGGMRVSPALARRFSACFGLPLLPVWGSTETAGIALANCPGELFKPGSVGRPCPYYEMRLLDAQGAEVGPDEPGELLVRGPAVCADYLGEAGASERQLRDGWFHTGDLFRRDADGCFFFMGRQSGLIKKAGVKIYPTELEDVLGEHPAIREVAVVGVPDAIHGEVPKAVIVLRPGAVLTAADVLGFGRQHLAPYKLPAIVEFVPELPKTSGGKILYRQLAGGASESAPAAEQ